MRTSPTEPIAGASSSVVGGDDPAEPPGRSHTAAVWLDRMAAPRCFSITNIYA
jgi:hypothetical protein